MRLFRLWDVTIYVNPFFLAVLGLFLAAGVLLQGLAAFLVVLLHELAHLAAARRRGMGPGEVELLPFGGVARLGGELALSPADELRVALAGPACNLVLTAAALVFKSHGVWHAGLGPFFVRLNLMLAGFNLLPAFPLDGGRIYRAFLANRVGLKKATYRAAGLGQAIGVLTGLLGVAGLVLGTGGLDMAVVGCFLFYAATREKGMAAYHYVRHLARKKSEIARTGLLPVRLLACVESLPVGEVVKPFLPNRFQVVFLLNESCGVSGCLGEGEIIEGLFKFGPHLPVGRLLPRL
ncbi:MAG: M50 family metallopeptidase [Peptococcaceae bacterium]|nr:M50 family metallopeptidase [Peptococcaceae bacterium]